MLEFTAKSKLVIKHLDLMMQYERFMPDKAKLVSAQEYVVKKRHNPNQMIKVKPRQAIGKKPEFSLCSLTHETKLKSYVSGQRYKFKSPTQSRQ